MSDIIERVYISSVEQSNAINATKEKSVTRDVMAGFYADCIRADALAFHNKDERVNFREVNQAIMQRWPKGLSYIKDKAWKILGH